MNSKMKSMVAGVCGVVLMWAAATSASAQQVIRVGTLATYAPYEFVDPKTGEYVGFDMDVMRAILAKEGYTMQVSSMQLDALIPSLMTNKIDVAISSLMITPERQQRVDFSLPYGVAGQSVMTTKTNAPKIKSLKDLEGKTLCAELGSVGAKVSSELPGTTVKTFNSIGDAFMELNRNACYAMINGSDTNAYFMTKSASRSMNLVDLGWTLESGYYGIAVKKGDAKTLAMINDGLKKILADGTFDKISQKWFGRGAPDAIKKEAQ